MTISFYHYIYPPSRSMRKKCRRFFAVLSATLFFNMAGSAQHDMAFSKPATYYFSPSGNDKNKGTKQSPWQTPARLNSISLKPGDIILLEGGGVFHGSIQLDSADAGSSQKPVLVSSYGKGPAIIQAGNGSAIVISGAKHIVVKNVKLSGSGRKAGNIKDGISIINSRHITVNNIEVTGFQKAGLLIYSSSAIAVSHVHAYENGYAGISVESAYGKRDAKDIHITDCIAENNPGDPSNLDNHSGNGIVAGNCKNVIIEYCVATNNGWDMPRIGNGPVGIWCYEADSVTMRYCISYSNKTAKGADDGGGFDLDGGVTNSLIEYCLSYNNQGSAFGIFQYAGASPWHGNIIRNNISENDGEVSAAHAAAYIWNSSGDAEQFSNLAFYDNIVYNAKGTAIHYADKQNRRKAFHFYNNVFVAKDELIKGEVSSDIFSGNTWWSLASRFNADGIKDFRAWALKTGKEQKNGKITGKNIRPLFKNAGNTTLTDPRQLAHFISNY